MTRMTIAALSLALLFLGCKNQNSYQTSTTVGKKNALKKGKSTAKKETKAKKVTPKAKAIAWSAKQGTKACSYRLTSAKPGWTAYKYTSKAPVSGTFNVIKLSQTKAGKSLTEALVGVTMSITPKSVESKNPARNKTIATKFFALFLNALEIKGEVVNVKGDDNKGVVGIKISMNGISKVIGLDYNINKGALTATKSVSMLDFGLQKAWTSIHNACKALHTGKDGVSKTWKDVLLKVNAVVTRDCK